MSVYVFLFANLIWDEEEEEEEEKKRSDSCGGSCYYRRNDEGKRERVKVIRDR